MTSFATVTLIIAVAGIATLFALKALETSRGTVLLPGLRERADDAAIALKSWLFRLRAHSDRILPSIGLIVRWLVHEAAIGFAAAAHWSAVQAHRLADSVSHKHHFERTEEPRSAFLREVAEVKANPERPTVVPPPIVTIREEYTAPAPQTVDLRAAAPAPTLAHVPGAPRPASEKIAAAVAERFAAAKPVEKTFAAPTAAKPARKQPVPKKKGIARTVVKKTLPKKPRVEMIA